MARAATTTDAFNAVAEPRRRQILEVLRDRELPVNELVVRVGLTQPQVSKHLRVLREVDLVRVRDDGRHRLYRVNGGPLKEVNDWVAGFAAIWNERFDVMDEVIADLLGSAQPELDPPQPDRAGQP